MKITLGYLGDATTGAPCPSVQQMMGVVDPNDPCQAAVAGPPPCMPTGSQGPLAPGQVWCDTGTGVPPEVAYSPGGGVTPPAQAQAQGGISKNTLLIGAGAVILIMALMGGRRR